MNETNVNNIAEAPTTLEEQKENTQPEAYVTPKSSGQSHPDVSNAADGTGEKKEHTRSRMAILFVLGFFAILFLCFVYAIMVGATLGDLKDTLVGVIGALSGILGFIVGYYYKTSQEQ